MTSDADPRLGQHVLIDLARAAATASGAYTNLVLTAVDEHVVRMSVMTEPYYWHRHPDGDEAFIVIEGVVLLQIADEQIELRAGQLYTVPRGAAHVTSPLTARSVNLTLEKREMTTERVPAPADWIPGRRGAPQS